MTDSEPSSIGSPADMASRLRAVLPAAWFPLTSPGSSTSMSPVLDGVLAGIATAWSYCFVLLQFVRAQARLSTMSGSILDLMAFDFFRATLTRRPGEGDLEFSARVRSNLLLPRATRQATSDMMQTLTGLAPVIFEPRRGSDAGAYGSPWLGYGSNVMPFQYLITIDAAGPSVRRETEASYIDQAGQLKLAPRHALRPLYANGAASSALIESRSWNLIKDSVAWSGFSPADPGSVAAWGIDNSDPLGLWPNQPVLRMTIGGSGLIVGPSVSAYIGTGAACASIWVFIPSGHTLISLAVSVTDGLSTTVAPVDLSVVDRWQRVSASLDIGSGKGRTMTAHIAGAAASTMSGAVITQSWQIEPGTAASSYIPSSGQIGMRDADVVSTLPDIYGGAAFTRQDVQDTIGRVVPAGSIAWLNVQSRLQ
jgi:hypothetical protein